jgi:hypothetical protein
LFDDVAIEIKLDEQLLERFELNIESGNMCVGIEIKGFDGPLQFSPSKHRCHPKVRQTLIEIATQNERATNKTTTNERAKNDPTTNERATKCKFHDDDDILSDSNYDMLFLDYVDVIVIVSICC